MSPTARRLLIFVMLLVAAGFARLGVWQLDRLHRRRAANAATMAGRLAPAVTLTAATQHPESLGQRRVVARGRYDQGRDIVLRGNVLEGTPGVLIVTPLLLGDRGPAVLVERGFVPSPDAVTVDLGELQEPGEMVVRGVALPVPRAGGAPIEHAGRTTWRRLDLAALRERLPYDVLPVYIQQSPDSALPSFPRRLAPAPIDEGPHLNYAIQWFFFAAMVAGFAVLVVGRGAGSGAREAPL
jgi:surfeit locus 1 family protein